MRQIPNQEVERRCGGKVDTELAVPVESNINMHRTPHGVHKSADGSRAARHRFKKSKQSEGSWKGSVRERANKKKTQGKQSRGQKYDGGLKRGPARLRRAMRRCLKLRQGASPLRPPAPFPSNLIIGGGEDLSRVRKPRKKRAPLTNPLPHEQRANKRERGPLAGG
jgi:hypothetical protein